MGPSPGNIYSFNRYAYANNNPIINIDPDGRCPDGDMPGSCGYITRSHAQHPGALQALGPYDADATAVMAGVIDRAQVSGLLGRDWIAKHQDLIITGPTGAGKTWLTCALAHQATRMGLPVLYLRLPRLLEELEIASETGNLHA